MSAPQPIFSRAIRTRSIFCSLVRRKILLSETQCSAVARTDGFADVQKHSKQTSFLPPETFSAIPTRRQQTRRVKPLVSVSEIQRDPPHPPRRINSFIAANALANGHLIDHVIESGNDAVKFREQADSRGAIFDTRQRGPASPNWNAAWQQTP